MTDSNNTSNFSSPSIVFQTDSIQSFKNLVKELGDEQKNNPSRRKYGTQLLTEINNALIEDVDLIPSFLAELNSEFFSSLLLLVMHKLITADREFCTQCILFFNLIKQFCSNEPSSVSLQSIPFFLSLLEKRESSENNNLLTKILVDYLKFQDQDKFFQLLIRNKAYQSFLDALLQVKDRNCLDILKYFEKILNSKNATTMEMFIRKLRPTIQLLTANAPVDICDLARKIVGCLKVDVPVAAAPVVAAAYPPIVSSTIVPPKPTPASASPIGCPCGCGELNKCKFQEEVYMQTQFVALTNLQDSSSTAMGLYGKVTGQFGYLMIDPTISKNIWNCTIRFVENKGFCRVGVVSVTKDFPYGDVDSPNGNLAYDNMGNYVQSPQNTISSRKGWKKDAQVMLEVDMNKRQICFFVNHVLQNVAFTNIPGLLRVYTWNVNPSTVHIVKFAPAQTSTTITEQMRVIKWDTS